MNPIVSALGLVAALFALAGGGIALLGPGARNPGAQGELWRAYRSTAIIIVAILGPAFINPWLFALVLVGAGARCAYELVSIYPPGAPSSAGLAAFLGLGGLAVLAGSEQAAPAAPAFAWASFALLLASLPVFWVALHRPLAGIARWIAAAVFPLLAVSHLSHLVFRPDGAFWIVVVYGSVEAHDSGAYVVGRLFGRRPVFPRLSPRKTLEGLFGGLLVGVLVSLFLCRVLVHLPWGVAIAAALALVGAGLAGDLFTSRIKRVAGVKDFPALSATHGGLLDVYDSTLFAALPLGLVLAALQG